MSKLKQSLQNITLRTVLLFLISLCNFTLWVSWNFCVAFELKNAKLTTWSIAIADFGRVLAASMLIFLPQFLNKQFYLQLVCGVIACTLGCISPFLANGSLGHIILIFISFFCTGVSSNPQIINAFTNVSNRQETKLNSIAFSVGKSAAFGAALVTLVPLYNITESWAALSLGSLAILCVIFVSKLILEVFYSNESEDEPYQPIISQEEVTTKFSDMKLYIWVVLISISARGVPRSTYISLAPLVFHAVWHLSKVHTAFHYFVPLVISACLFPLISILLSSYAQLILGNLLICLAVALFPFSPMPLLGSLDLIVYGISACALEAVRVPLLKDVFGSDTHAVTRMIGMQHITYTIFYALPATYNGYLYEYWYAAPFIACAAVHVFAGVIPGFIGMYLWRQEGSNVKVDVEEHIEEISGIKNENLNDDQYLVKTIRHNMRRESTNARI